MPRLRKPSAVQARRAAARDERTALAAAKPKKGAAALDSFQNFGLNLGIGTANALSGSTYGFNPITRVRTLLEWIYRGTWLGGAAIDPRAEDMTRAGIEINSTSPPEETEKIQKALKRRGVWTGIRDTKRWASLYGGAIGVLLIDGQDLSQPLRVDAIGRGAFKGMAVLDRWMVDPTISAGGLVDELGPRLGEPKFYNVRTDSAMLPGNKIHYTRCLRLLGDKMPYWQSVMENLWGTSVYERIYDRLVAFDSATQGIAQTCYKSYIRTYKVDRLREIVTAGGPAYQGLLRYVNMMRMFQGIEGATLLDGKDEFVVQAPNVTPGMSEALVQFGQQLCGALRTPAVRLFGQSPAGMNATGDSDWRNYYDGINQDQETDLREFVHLVISVTSRSEGVELEDDTDFNFTPLWQMTAQQKAEVAGRKTSTILEVQASGLYGRGTALKELRQQSRETGVHTNITDDDIEKAEEEDEMNPPGLESAQPGAGGEAGQEGGAEVKNLESLHSISRAVGAGGLKDEELRAGTPAGAGERRPGVPPAPRLPRGADQDGFIDNRFDVRCGAVADKDGRGIYVHWAFPRYSDKVLRGDGRPLDLWTAIYHHEMPELRGMVDEGMTYLTAHRKRGTPGERAYVESQGADWTKYTQVVAGELAKIEHMPVRNPPPNPHVDPDAAVCHRAGAKDGAARDGLPLRDVGGLPILVEVERGCERWPGKRWPADYGYIRRTESAEGSDEAMDCFLGSMSPEEWAARDRPAYVINHYAPDGSFEEHKVMLCYGSAGEAVDDYAAAYPYRGRQAAFAFTLPKLRDWLERGDVTRPLMRVAS